MQMIDLVIQMNILRLSPYLAVAILALRLLWILIRQIRRIMKGKSAQTPDGCQPSRCAGCHGCAASGRSTGKIDICQTGGSIHAGRKKADPIQ